MRKQLFFLLVGLVLSAVLLSTSAFAQTNIDNQLVIKNKAKIESIGVGPLVSIQLQNKEKLKGRIVRVSSDNFIISDSKSGGEQTINYRDVRQVKRTDNGGVSTGVKAGIIIAGVLFVLSLIGNGFGG